LQQRIDFNYHNSFNTFNYGVCHTPDTVLQRDTHSQDETRKLLEENNSIDNGDSSHVEKKTDGPKHLETKDEILLLTSQMFIPESLPGLYNTRSMADHWFI
jgi:hypothetical protein